MFWLRYFQANAARRMPIPWELGIHVEKQLRDALVRSLQRFQVGEQGDGDHLKRGAASTGDQVYAETIRLFIAEEQEHSRLLARAIEGMGGSLLRWHWSDAVFMAVRRLCGLKLELAVLLTAEMIAKVYYRALFEGTRDPVLRALFAQILHDEVGHVSFHREFLQRAYAPLPLVVRAVLREVWRAFYRTVCLLVMYDHRSVLRATNMSMGEFWRGCNEVFRDVVERIFDPALLPEEVWWQGGRS